MIIAIALVGQGNDKEIKRCVNRVEIVLSMNIYKDLGNVFFSLKILQIELNEPNRSLRKNIDIQFKFRKDTLSMYLIQESTFDYFFIFPSISKTISIGTKQVQGKQMA